MSLLSSDWLSSVGQDIWKHREEDSPLEAVGLVFLDGRTYRLINQARSEHRYSVNEALVAEAVELHDSPLVAIYHSHTWSPSGPSRLDQHMMREMASDEQWAHIVSLILGTDGLKGWIWQETDQGDLHEIALHYWAEAITAKISA